MIDDASIEVSNPPVKITSNDSEEAIWYIKGLKQKGEVDTVQIEGTFNLDGVADVERIIEEEADRISGETGDSDEEKQINGAEDVMALAEAQGVDPEELVQTLTSGGTSLPFTLYRVDLPEIGSEERETLAARLNAVVEDFVDGENGGFGVRETQDTGDEKESDSGPSDSSEETVGTPPDYQGGQKGVSKDWSPEADWGERKAQVVEFFIENKGEWVTGEDFREEYGVANDSVGNSALHNGYSRLLVDIEKDKQQQDTGRWRSRYRYDPGEEDPLKELGDGDDERGEGNGFRIEDGEEIESHEDEFESVEESDEYGVTPDTYRYETLVALEELDGEEEDTEWFSTSNLSKHTGRSINSVGANLTNLKGRGVVDHNLDRRQWRINDRGRTVLKAIEQE